MIYNANGDAATRFKPRALTVMLAMCSLGCATGALAQDKGDESLMEEVLVVAQFKQSLQDALNNKREATTIIDGISADDIGSLPALDMGEALQAVPGVQLNREGERRESSVNLRGLPSGFVLTTANGQTIASPTRSNKAFGAPNPFGVYDPAIFGGINVIKTPTADMPEGGIAGTVDQKLTRALDAKETSLKLSISNRYEELADAHDPEFVVSGSKHLADGTFGVVGTVAWSKQNFRRDTIKINRYDALEPRFDEDTVGQSYDEWLATTGAPADAVVEMPGELRQSIETNDGDRLSFSGGIEWAPTEELKFGANIIYTERDMDNNGFEQVDMRPRQSGALVRPTSDPMNTGTTTEDGREIWSVSAIDIRNVQVGFDSRESDLYAQSQAIVLDGSWQNDDWKVYGALTVSDAEASFDEVLLAQRYRPTGGNPLTATLRTGEGNITNFLATLDSSDPSFTDVGSIDWPDPQLSMGSRSSITAGNRQFGVTGTWEGITRDSESIDFSAERFFDSWLTSVKFGYRMTSEDADSKRYRNSTIGIDMNEVDYTLETLRGPAYVGSASYFGGEAPGFLQAADANGLGWISFDPGTMIDALTATIPSLDQIAADADTGEQPFLTHRGFIQRGRQQSAGLVYDTSIDTQAAFVMANFALDLGAVPMSGNVGLRHVQSDLTAGAPLFDLDNVENATRNTSSHDYNYVLPSLNLAFDFTDDLKLRLGYSEGIVRPNLRFARPSSTLRITGEPGGDVQTATVELPGVKVDPFDSTSYDMSLEWYNREGSAITFAVFQKEINNFFDKDGTCDNAVLEESGFSSLVGTVSEQNDLCVTSGVDGVIDANSEVSVTQLVNVDQKITVEGYEFSVQQNLDFLPSPWNGIGGVLNYSHTEQGGDDDIAIPGISDDTYNAIVYYEQDTFGVRLAYNYRSDYELESVGTFNGAGDKSVRAAGRLDLSTYVNVTDSTKLRFKAYNLTETLYEEYESVEWQPRATHFDGRTFVLSLNHSFF